jgi:hypothetical protein
MASPNMSQTQFERWLATPEFREYQAYRGVATVQEVVERTRAVLAGRATEADEQKVGRFIARMKEQSAGQQRFGSGSTAVSAKTAALRNWGFDPTGRFS